MMQWYADYLDALRTGMSPTQQASFARQINARHPQLARASPQRNETDEIPA
jgi:hypothetical protein